MGMTMTQKILAAHAGLDTVSPGQLIKAKLDIVLGNDITTPVAVNEFKKAVFDGVFDKDKIAIVLDHVKGSGVKAVEETASNHSMTVSAETWDSYIEAVKADLAEIEKEVG